MDQTDYFKRRVLRDRPYIRLDWCEQAVRAPEATEVQPDGRIRHWIYVNTLGKHLRVVTLADGKTLHNAFPDRTYKREGS
jgi:hypothetical protein